MPRNPYKPLNQFDDESDKDDEDASASAFENFSLLNNNSDQSSSTTNKKKLDDSPLIELRARNANKFQQQSFNDFSPSSAENMVFIERKIRKSDSLRNLALQFGISVSFLTFCAYVSLIPLGPFQRNFVFTFVLSFLLN